MSVTHTARLAVMDEAMPHPAKRRWSISDPTVRITPLGTVCQRSVSLASSLLTAELTAFALTDETGCSRASSAMKSVTRRAATCVG